MATAAAQTTSWFNGRTFESWREEFDRCGYLIFERVLSTAKVAEIRAALAPHLARDMKGRNDFEGERTNRVYALMAKSPVFAELAIHPLALAFAEAELGGSCLLSALLAINLHPGETCSPGILTTAARKFRGRGRRSASAPFGRSTIRPSKTAPPRSSREAICGTDNSSRAR
jgi:hypothetical protein